MDMFTCLLLYMCVTKCVRGLNVSLTGPDHAVINQSYTFLCSGSPAADMLYRVNFIKRSTGSSIMCTVDNCVGRSSLPGYSCGCAGFSGNTKLYNMTINSISLSDEFNWMCTHAIDDTSNIVYLPVYSPVSSVNIKVSGTMPRSVDVREGDLTVFTCLIQGAKPSPTVSQIMWYTEVTTGNNQLLPGSPGTPATSDRMTSLDFTYNVSRQHNKQNVFCTAINSVMVDGGDPAVTSTNKIKLLVKYPPLRPPEIKGYRTATPIYEGDTLCISCEVKGGNPLVSSVDISCYGGHQNTSSRVEGDTVIADLCFVVSRNLNLKTCQCSASHETNRYTDTDQETVTVYYPPSVPTLQPDPRGFPWLEGQQDRYLRCSVSDRGNPQSEYVWFRDDVKDSSQTSSTWTFSNLSYTDNGSRFCCQAQNRYTLHKHHPQSSNVQSVNVHYRPRVKLNQGTSVQVQEGKLLLLICSSNSNPRNATLEWFWGAQFMGNDPVLQIPNFTKDHQGIYTCKATANSPSFGLLKGFANSTVRVMQPFPESCYCTDSSADTVTLHWRYDDNNSSTLKSFTILKRSGNEHKWTQLSLSNPVGEESIFTLDIGQLGEMSWYYFKIYISSGGDASGYCLTSCKTDPASSIVSSSLTGGAGIAIGTVVGIVVTSLAFIIVIILWRRGLLFKSSKSDKTQAEINTYQDISLDDRITTTGNELGTSQQANAYEGLENREPTPYSQLELYENVTN